MYTLHRPELQKVFEQKDIGIILDRELKLDEGISVNVKKGEAMVGQIRRNFSYLDGPLFRKLFTTFEKPHLEYGQVIWTSYLKKCVTIVEDVRRQTTKLVD